MLHLLTSLLLKENTLTTNEEHLQLFLCIHSTFSGTLDRLCLLPKKQVFSPVMQGSPTHLRPNDDKSQFDHGSMNKKTATFEKEPKSGSSPESVSGLRKITPSMLGQGGTSNFRDPTLNRALCTSLPLGHKLLYFVIIYSFQFNTI